MTSTTSARCTRWRRHESVRRLAELNVGAIVCYHGGVVDDDANGQLRRLAAAVGVVRA